ncbi:MAG: peptidylprolyl isomerase [Prevotellaceae bacterium]|jgi:peptidyl-prolyl cis-trans isomerase SurA|nr:peptidylprolyl isomerase [Prevotellaceae bacterium]
MRKLFLSFLLLALLQNTFAQDGLIDKVVAVVGREMILLYDIELEVGNQRLLGVTSDKNLHCEVLENLLLQKLLLAQARLDSLKVSDEEVDAQIDWQVRQMTMRAGSEKAVEELFHKPMFQLKKDLREIVHEQILTKNMHASLVKDAPITPTEVEKTYKQIPKDSLPIIPTQYVLRQIIVNPPASEAKFDVRKRLLELRERIVNGEKFSTLAILYSEDPASALRGGELGLRYKQELAPAFSDAALALKPGQVSPIVETEFGFHIIQLIEKQGNEMFNCRHILLKPQYTANDRTAAFRKLDSIATLIRAGELSFERAALRLSEDSKTNTSGGLMVNEENLSSRFEKDQLNPADFGVLRNMKEGDISIPYESQDKMGNTQYKIIRLERLIPTHTANLENDYSVIQQLAKQQRQQATFEKWIKQKQAAALIRIDPMFGQCQFEREGWRK